MARKILVVEDDRLVQATLAQGLAAHGFEAAQAFCGQEALAKVERFKPDLALVDIRLPDISGPEVAKILDQKFGTAVLFLSAYDDQAAVSQALEAGGLGYLVKPFTVAQLVPELEAVLSLAQKLRQFKIKEGQLTAALESNRVISLAVGVLMERMRLTHRKAYEFLRRKARNERCKVLELASKVVEAANRLNQLENKV